MELTLSCGDVKTASRHKGVSGIKFIDLTEKAQIVVRLVGSGSLSDYEDSYRRRITTVRITS